MSRQQPSRGAKQKAVVENEAGDATSGEDVSFDKNDSDDFVTNNLNDRIMSDDEPSTNRHRKSKTKRSDETTTTTGAVNSKSKRRKLTPEQYEAYLDAAIGAEDNEDDGADNDFDMDVKDKNVLEAGQILSIDMTNFMCHRKFSIDFGRHLNFISGKNGSGTFLIYLYIF
jgi:hypothetical protein